MELTYIFIVLSKTSCDENLYVTRCAQLIKVCKFA